MKSKRALLYTIPIFLFLTVISQIGGIVYLLSLWLSKRVKQALPYKTAMLFLVLYLTFSAFIVPPLAAKFGRVPVPSNNTLKPLMLATKLLNRNYVKPELASLLQGVAQQIEKAEPGLEIYYLDACFPFFDGFPLLPHLSHKDGKKIDLSFIYQTENNKHSNRKKSRTGYGIFEGPLEGEIDQTEICKSKGYWQYDFTKYFSFGSINERLSFSESATKLVLQKLLNEPKTEKIFFEPHLAKRLGLKHPKLRFHGCQAVRHDDHIHIQIK